MENEKRKLKEAKEIAYLEKELKKPKFAGYLFFFVLVITIVYLVDEVTTNIGKFMELDVAVAFFGTSDAYDAATTTGLIGTLITVISGTAMLLRPLADRFGRKIFLFIYTLGMSIAMGIIAISHSIPGWVVGTLLIEVCIPHDMQTVYIQECAPKEKRGTYFSVIKSMATLGLMLVPLFRMLFKVDTYSDHWRYVYIGTAAVGLIAAILSAIFMRESDVYIMNRLHQLKMTDEERELAKKEKTDEAKRGGIIAGIIHIFKHKQLMWLAISMALAMVAYVLTDHYSAIIGIGYLNANNLEISAANYQLKEVSNLVTKAIFMYPIGCAFAELFPGIIADKIGRKKAAIIFGVSALCCYVAFYFGSVYVIYPQVLGLLLGAACGSVWGFGDLILLMITESTETNLRVSANTSSMLIAGACYALAKAVIESVCKGLGSDSYMGLLTIIVVIFGLTGSIIISSLKVKETKNTDLNSVTAKDFE